MNRFWIVLTMLFSMKLTTSVSVSADNYFFENGIDSYKKGIKHYGNKRYNEGDRSFKESIKFLEEALKEKLTTSQENQAHLRLGISRYYDGKFERAIDSLDLALRQGKLNYNQRAEAYFYWGMSLLATRKPQKVPEKFEKALKFNPSLKLPPWCEDNNQAKRLLEEARKIVDKTPPIIRLIKPHDGAKFEVNQRITISAEVTDNISVKEVLVHFSPTDKRPLSKVFVSDTYTWEGNGKSIRYYRYYLTATDEKGNKSRYPKKGKLEITLEPVDKTPPIIRLIKPHDGAKFEVNQRITISAEVTDNISVKEVLVHFSKKIHVRSKISETDPGIYTIGITVPEDGDIWYHLTATDEAGHKSEEKRRLKIENPIPPPPPEPEYPLHQEIWAAWSTDVFKYGVFVFDLGGRDEVFSLAYLRERKDRWTFGAQLDISTQNPALMKVPYLSSVTCQLGYPLRGSPIVLTMLLGGVAEYRRSDSFILGLGLKGYLGDRVAIDATGSIYLRSDGAFADEGSIEAGIRLYNIYRALYLRLGSRRYLGNRSTTEVKIGLGAAF